MRKLKKWVEVQYTLQRWPKSSEICDFSRSLSEASRDLANGKPTTCELQHQKMKNMHHSFKEKGRRKKEEKGRKKKINS